MIKMIEKYRPEGYMENPYIGKDGRDYHSLEALRRADGDWERIHFAKKPSALEVKASEEQTKTL